MIERRAGSCFDDTLRPCRTGLMSQHMIWSFMQSVREHVSRGFSIAQS